MFDPPAEPEPNVEFGEFQISMRYVENGEEKKVDDIVTCKYIGRACDGRGLHNDWSYHLASGNNKILVKILDNERYLHKPTGDCGQLMSDLYPINNTVLLHYREDTWSVDKALDEDVLASDYGITITNYSVKRKP